MDLNERIESAEEAVKNEGKVARDLDERIQELEKELGHKLPSELEPGMNADVVLKTKTEILRTRLNSATPLKRGIQEILAPPETIGGEAPPEARVVREGENYVPEGGKGWLGWFKNIFGKRGSKVVGGVGKRLPWLGVVTAPNEGEAGFGLFLIGAAEVIPGANIVLGVVTVAVIGSMVGHALYRWWKGPIAEPPPNIDLPLPEEHIGPVTHVEHVEQPPPGKETHAPSSLRMRKPTPSKTPLKPSLSITETYDRETGTAR